MTEKVPDSENLSLQMKTLSIYPKEEECEISTAESVHITETSQSTQETKCGSPDANEHSKLQVLHLSRLRGWINHRMTIEMTDGRILIGTFLCTDRDANIILGSCGEYISPQVYENKEENGGSQEARLLGLVMVPGQHIVNILHDQPHVT